MPRQRPYTDKVSIKFDTVEAYFLNLYCERLNITPRQFVKGLVNKELKSIYPEFFDDGKD